MPWFGVPLTHMLTQRLCTENALSATLRLSTHVQARIYDDQKKPLISVLDEIQTWVRKVFAGLKDMHNDNLPVLAPEANGVKD